MTAAPESRGAPGPGAPDRLAPAWIAADWGTSRLRVWAMAADGRVLAERGSDRGMGALARDGFEPALLDLVAGWLAAAPAPVIACGMVGARQGWVEAAYRPVPCPPLGAPVAAPARDPRLRVHILPGLSQASPPDVMRGEETQIAGWLAASPGFDGVLCLPGTHSKWAEVSAGEVVAFRTFMTGEVFAALSLHSVLRHSVAPDDPGEGWDDDTFAAALGDALARPERLAGELFGIRAATLLAGLGPAAARARLSGLLIGAELAATRPYWLGREVAVIGAPALARRYAAALGLQGLAPALADGSEMVRAGLAMAHAARLPVPGTA